VTDGDKEGESIIRKDCIVMKIPVGLLITVHTARRESEVGRLMYQQELLLLEERESDGEGEGEEEEGEEEEEEEGEVEGEEVERKEEEEKEVEEEEEEEEEEELGGEGGEDFCEVWGLDMSAPMHGYLAAFILEDRLNPDSRFLPYYDTLPLALPHIPIFWSKKDLQCLYGSFLYQQVIERLGL
jgi:hypothetical protein